MKNYNHEHIEEMERGTEMILKMVRDGEKEYELLLERERELGNRYYFLLVELEDTNGNIYHGETFMEEEDWFLYKDHLEVLKNIEFDMPFYKDGNISFTINLTPQKLLESIEATLSTVEAYCASKTRLDIDPENIGNDLINDVFDGDALMKAYNTSANLGGIDGRK